MIIVLKVLVKQPINNRRVYNQSKVTDNHHRHNFNELIGELREHDAFLSVLVGKVHIIQIFSRE